MEIEITVNGKLEEEEVVSLYQSNGWSSAEKPKELMAALEGSHTVIAGRVDSKLVGLCNALSDGHLVVYYPHMLVHPNFHRKGVGRKMMEAMHSIYKEFHQQILVADGRAIDFYNSLGFSRAGKSEPMWIYQGNEH
ncbi:GNAT family N-acetyltransferase [Teredinibacter turnerae]|uniref:GNAT family N-acetyltransferase n=1 Tax=Teredinibacter turnerae TaxID=2426 RepID=UPI0030CBCF7D